MYENTEEDIHEGLNYLPISLFSNKIKVGIIGGGRAALIKAKGLYSKGCIVEIISLEFLEEFNNFNSERITLKTESYKESFIHDKHIVIIAINDSKVIDNIIEDCNKKCKIFINSSNFKNGLGVIPVSRETDSLCISINTKEGNPKAAVLAADYAKESLKKLDGYINYTSTIRNNHAISNDIKKELLEFIHSEDYRYFYNKRKEFLVLKMFYGDIEEIISFK